MSIWKKQLLEERAREKIELQIQIDAKKKSGLKFCPTCGKLDYELRGEVWFCTHCLNSWPVGKHECMICEIGQKGIEASVLKKHRMISNRDLLTALSVMRISCKDCRFSGAHRLSKHFKEFQDCCVEISND
jgi:hypothetical protein